MTAGTIRYRCLKHAASVAAFAGNVRVSAIEWKTGAEMIKGLLCGRNRSE